MAGEAELTVGHLCTHYRTRVSKGPETSLGKALYLYTLFINDDVATLVEVKEHPLHSG
jgi:hypothetical protein